MVLVSTIDIAHTLECALQGHPDTTSTHDHNPIHALMIFAINRARVPKQPSPYMSLSLGWLQTSPSLLLHLFSQWERIVFQVVDL